MSKEGCLSAPITRKCQFAENARKFIKEFPYQYDSRRVCYNPLLREQFDCKNVLKGLQLNFGEN